MKLTTCTGNRHHRLGCVAHESHATPLASFASLLILLSSFVWVGLIAKWAVDGAPFGWWIWVPIALYVYAWYGLWLGVFALENRFVRD